MEINRDLAVKTLDEMINSVAAEMDELRSSAIFEVTMQVAMHAHGLSDGIYEHFTEMGFGQAGESPSLKTRDDYSPPLDDDELSPAEYVQELLNSEVYIERRISALKKLRDYVASEDSNVIEIWSTELAKYFDKDVPFDSMLRN